MENHSYERASDEESGFQLGQRVHCVGDCRRIGTVKYVGPVNGYSGAWIGVDWDAGEGKHDGTLNGVRYFNTAGNKSGSFVRPHLLSRGISFLEALELRYHRKYAEVNEGEMYVLSTRNARVAVELVGKDKIQEKLSRFDELRAASVSYHGVSTTGPPYMITSLVPNLKDLDVTGNLLSNWQDVASICEGLQALEILNLSNNYMMHDIPLIRAFKSIRILVLNNCRITWAQPSHPSTVAAFVDGFDTLRLLNLDDNCINSWDEVMKLSQLKRLEQLHLNKNNLKQIYYPIFLRCDSVDSYESEEKLRQPFENLRTLLLGGNCMEDINSIDSLNNFPNLVDVRLSENPVADPERGGMPRFALIARLEKLQMLNGGEVSMHERKESEIRYIHLVMSKMHSCDAKELKQLHPRFDDLKKVHGIEDKHPVSGSMGPQKLAFELITITLKCVGPSIGEKPSMTKKLPPMTTVGKLKILCESFFKLKSFKLRLFVQEEGSPLPVLLDDELASLAELGIGSGCAILVDEQVPEP